MSGPKVPLFLSWSGSDSRRVAEILRENLPHLLNAIEPWTSDSIEKGEEWHSELAVAIQAAKAAIVCITPTNLLSPWLHFESGALWSLGNAVCPYLFHVSKSALAGTPLSHLQASEVFVDEDSRKLFWKLNVESGELLSELQFHRSFAHWWPRVRDELAGLSGGPTSGDLKVAQALAADVSVPLSAIEPDSFASSHEPPRTTSPPNEDTRDIVAQRQRRSSEKRRTRNYAAPFPDRKLARSTYEQVFLKLVSGNKLKVGREVYTPVGMKGWYHAVFRRERDNAEKLLTIDQLLKKMNDWV